MLPSQALSQGTTFDLYVLDTHSRYVKYQEAKAEGKPVSTGGKPRPRLTDKDLQAMVNQVRANPRKMRRNAKS